MAPPRLAQGIRNAEERTEQPAVGGWQRADRPVGGSVVPPRSATIAGSRSLFAPASSTNTTGLEAPDARRDAERGVDPDITDGAAQLEAIVSSLKHETFRTHDGRRPEKPIDASRT